MLTTLEMVTLLHRGEVDFACRPLLSREDIECQVVFVDPILVAVPNGHRLADRTSVCLTELKDECFVGMKRGYGTRDLVDSVCKSAGIDLKYVYEGDEPTRLISLVEAEIDLPSYQAQQKYHGERLNICKLRIMNLYVISLYYGIQVDT